MNQVIKFIAWDARLGKMRTEDDFFVRCGLAYRISELDGLQPTEWILRRFTGLHDCNGFEIFEGDILHVLEVCNQRTEDYISEVSWSDCGFDVYPNEHCSQSLGSFNCLPEERIPMYEMEVIGNIYENEEIVNDTNI